MIQLKFWHAALFVGEPPGILANLETSGLSDSCINCQMGNIRDHDWRTADTYLDKTCFSWIKVSWTMYFSESSLESRNQHIRLAEAIVPSTTWVGWQKMNLAPHIVSMTWPAASVSPQRLSIKICILSNESGPMPKSVFIKPSKAEKLSWFTVGGLVPWCHPPSWFWPRKADGPMQQRLGNWDIINYTKRIHWKLE